MNLHVDSFCGKIIDFNYHDNKVAGCRSENNSFRLTV